MITCQSSWTLLWIVIIVKQCTRIQSKQGEKKKMFDWLCFSSLLKNKKHFSEDETPRNLMKLKRFNIFAKCTDTQNIQPVAFMRVYAVGKRNSYMLTAHGEIELSASITMRFR